jgi:hypothetical protein
MYYIFVLISIFDMNVEQPQPLRRSKRLENKNQKIKKEKYIQHIYNLHTVSEELLDMTNTLSNDNLRQIISEYECIIGGLLGVENE